MKLSGIIIGTLVAFIAILAIVGYPSMGAPGFLTSMMHEYGSEVSFAGMNNTIREMDVVLESVNETEKGISTSTITESTPSESWSNQVWSTLKLAFKPGLVFKAMLIDLSNAVGLPSWAVVLVGAIFTILIVYAFISVLKGWNS